MGKASIYKQSIPIQENQSSRAENEDDARQAKKECKKQKMNKLVTRIPMKIVIIQSSEEKFEEITRKPKVKASDYKWKMATIFILEPVVHTNYNLITVSTSNCILIIIVTLDKKKTKILFNNNS